MVVPAAPGAQPEPGGKIECQTRFLEIARAVVIGKVGEEFFTRHLTLGDCRYWPADEKSARGPYWSVSYRLQIEAKPWAKGEISLQMDSTGAIVDQYGLCDCLKHPSGCDYTVDESTAVDAAKLAGFSPGLRPWNVAFG